MAQLKNDLGTEIFTRAQRAYFQQWSFRHPSTTDFFDSFERASGRDLSAYRHHIVDGTSRLDWQVVSAKTEEAAADFGVFDRAGKRVTLEDGVPVAPDGKKSARGRRAPSGEKKEAYQTTVLFGNTGAWEHGASARLVFEDGAVLNRWMPGDARWVRYQVRYKSRLAYAVADPDRANAWDWNRLNDSKVLRVGTGPARTLGRRACAKYFGWTAYFVGIWTQILWALA
jgi:hypothetical protein